LIAGDLWGRHLTATATCDEARFFSALFSSLSSNVRKTPFYSATLVSF
jgi:hypothetical protein